MYLKHQPSGDLVEVVDTAALFDPFRDRLEGRLHAGEELQEVEVFPKTDLVFPSGESLPRCWTDGNYRQGS